MEKGEPKKASESNGRGEEPDKRGMGAGYQGAVEAALAIPIGSGLGYLADQQWGTEPAGLYIGVAVGFGAFILRLVRMRPE
ncbi:MAG: hypothetical protein OSB70_11300 [Myxococcota bacterium]|nr:hypothetical protein [Myxococcota bacterium]